MADIGGMRVVASLPSGAPGETLVCSKPGPGGSFLPVLVRRVPLAGAAPAADRATAELQRAALVRHHNVVQVLDVVADGAGVYTAYPGITLAVLLREAAITATPIPGPLAVFLVSEICKGLQAVHDAVDAAGQPLNLIHGDLTPDSVWLAWEGDIRVMDLGLAGTSAAARQQDGNESRAWFLSPEAARGVALDRRADVYSAAAILYRLVTGRPPYSGGSPAETLRLITEAPVPDARSLAPMLPPALGEMLSTGLAKGPAERFQTAAALGSTLQRFLDLARLSASPADLAAFLSRLLPEAHPLRTAWTAPMLQAFSGAVPPSGGDITLPPGVGLAGGLLAGDGGSGASLPGIPRSRSGTLLMTALTSGVPAAALHGTGGQRSVTQQLTGSSLPPVGLVAPPQEPAPSLPPAESVPTPAVGMHVHSGASDKPPAAVDVLGGPAPSLPPAAAPPSLPPTEMKSLEPTPVAASPGLETVELPPELPPVSPPVRLDADGLFAEDPARGAAPTTDAHAKPLDFTAPTPVSRPKGKPVAQGVRAADGGGLKSVFGLGAVAVALAGAGTWYMLWGPGAPPPEDTPAPRPPAVTSASQQAAPASLAAASAEAPAASTAVSAEPAGQAASAGSGAEVAGTSGVAAPPVENPAPPPEESGLPPGMGGVVVRAPATAEVFLNGKRVPAWADGETLKVKAGKYRLRVQDKPSKNKLQEKIVVVAGETLSFTLEPKQPTPPPEEVKAPAPPPEEGDATPPPPKKKRRKASAAGEGAAPPPPPPPPP